METSRQLIESHPRCKVRKYLDGRSAYLINGYEVTMLYNGLVKIEGYEPLAPERAVYILGIKNE